MSCPVPYIEKEYRKISDKLADRLTSTFHATWRKINSSKLFREYGNERLLSKKGTVIYEKQIAFIKDVNNNEKLIDLKPTKSGFNTKVIVNVHSIAQRIFNEISQEEQFKKRDNAANQTVNEEGDVVIKNQEKIINKQDYPPITLQC